MRVLLAQPSGFCAGVEMAVATVDRALELFGEPLYAFHQIVHNQVVVANLTRRGVRFVNDIADIPRGADVEERRVADESVFFPLPLAVR